MRPFLTFESHCLEREDNVNILTIYFQQIFTKERLLFNLKWCIV